MQYHWIEDIEKFRNIAQEWDKTLVSSGNYNPFLLSDFIITWWRHFHNNLRLRIFVVYDNGTIAGGIPLYLGKRKFRDGFASILSYIGRPAANYTEPFYTTSEIRILPLLQKALAKRKDWDALYLPDVRGENKLIAEYNDCATDRRFFFNLAQDHMNWAIDLSAGLEKYFSTIPKRLQRYLKTKRKDIVKKHGNLQLKQIWGKDEVGKYFDLYTEFSSHSFMARRRKSNFDNEKYSSFFRDFLTLMDQKQRLDTHVLMAGDKVLAISFGYRFGKGYNYALTSFNYDYKYFKPGYLLVEELIKETCKHGETYYNSYGYERFYKTQWCNSQIPLYRFLMIRHTLKGTIYRIFQATEKFLRSNKKTVTLIRKLKKS